MAACPDEKVFHDYFNGTMPAEEIDGFKEHVSQCSRCRILFEEFSRADRITALGWANEGAIKALQDSTDTSAEGPGLPETDTLLLQYVARPSESAWQTLPPTTRLKAFAIGREQGGLAIRLATLDIVGAVAPEGVSPAKGREIRLGPRLQAEQLAGPGPRPIIPEETPQTAKAAWSGQPPGGQSQQEIDIALTALRFITYLASLRPTASALDALVDHVAAKLIALDSDTQLTDSIADATRSYFSAH